jgi:hypothetical protein
MTVLLGRIVVAEVALTVTADRRPAQAPPTRDVARPYRRIFASYSHKDASIVTEVSAYARTLGDRYLVDVTDLRAGENWSQGLEQLIQQADIFQLFWSSNSMASPHVRREWEHALSLGRPDFVRPTYWEDPMPEQPGLPPEALVRLHFQKMCFPAAPALATEDPASPPQRPRRRTLTAVASAATLVVLGVFALALVNQPASYTAPTAAMPSPSAIERPGPVPPATAPSKARPAPTHRADKVFGEVIVDGRPGAKVTIDGRSYGRTPITRPIRLPRGWHLLVVTQPGYPTLRERFRIEGEEKRVINLRREPVLNIE